MAQRAERPRVPETVSPRGAEPLISAFHRFARMGASSGIVLLSMSILALVWANVIGWESYQRFWEGTTISFGLPEVLDVQPHTPEPKSPGESPPVQKITWDFQLSKSLLHWVNDGLMAMFFFLIGLEIKREALVGELRSIRKAALPIAAAIGGMVVPAALYAAFNWEKPSIRGWGVPMATDIAFALGVLALLGSRVPSALRIFLATLAIADDIGALLVIAIFYTEEIAFNWMGLAGVCMAVMFLMNWLGVRHAVPFALVGLVLWFMILKSGVHATIAGVLGAVTIPVRTKVDVRTFAQFVRDLAARLQSAPDIDKPVIASPAQQAMVQGIEDACQKVQSPLEQLEHGMAPWVAFGVLPVFALANAGVTFDAGALEAAASPIALGTVAGLLLGKPLGVTLASIIVLRLGWGQLPSGVRLAHIHGTSWLTGIGFTMSLFIANLAFSEPMDLTAAKIGVLGASTLAAIIGAGLLVHASRGRAGRAGQGE